MVTSFPFMKIIFLKPTIGGYIYIYIYIYMQSYATIFFGPQHIDVPMLAYQHEILTSALCGH